MLGGHNAISTLWTVKLKCVTLEVCPGQSEGQGEGGADQALSAQLARHPGVRPVILIRRKHDLKLKRVLIHAAAS